MNIFFFFIGERGGKSWQLAVLKSWQFAVGSGQLSKTNLESRQLAVGSGQC